MSTNWNGLLTQFDNKNQDTLLEMYRVGQETVSALANGNRLHMQQLHNSYALVREDNAMRLQTFLADTSFR